jgi:class 3 adenylate cyclase
MREDDAIPAWLETPEGTRHPLIKDCGLGRSRENDIVVDHPNVSRRHALIQLRDKGVFWIVDLGAKNGILLNASRVAVAKPLKPGDSIQIGEATFFFRQREGGSAHLGDALATVPPTHIKVEHLECWLLVVDLKGWARISAENSAAEGAAILDWALAPSRDVVESAGGKVDKNLGDGFLAFWRAKDFPAESIARAMNKLREVQSQAEIAYRLVLHRGLISIGATLTPGEEIQTGAEVNYVFRLEELGSDRGIDFCLSSEAQRHLAPFLRIEFVSGDVVLRNLEGLHSVYRIP